MPADGRRRGISLLEAVVGLAIVGMTAIGALSAAAAELRAAARARHALEASVLATQRLSILNVLTRSQLLSLPDSMAHGRFEPPFGDYHWTTVVTNREKEQGVYDVRMQVEWTGGVYAVYSALYRPPLIVGTP